MKSKQLLIQLTAALLVSSFAQAFADEPVTFTILAEVEYPGGVGNTYPSGINDNGGIAGYYYGTSWAGFVRFRDGHLSGPIRVPESLFTLAYGINNLGTLCGYYTTSDSFSHGFFVSGAAFTEYDVPNSTYTSIFDLNDAGDFCGSAGFGTEYEAFVSIGGTVTAFTVAGSPYTDAYGINNLNQCVGTYSSGDEVHSWLREADGTITFLKDPPNAFYTIVTGINDRGWMVGYDWLRPQTYRGLFYRTPTKAVEFEYPGASYTTFSAINGHGVICGYYQNSSGSHGFIVRVNLATED